MKSFYHGIRFALPISLIMWALFVLMLFMMLPGCSSSAEPAVARVRRHIEVPPPATAEPPPVTVPVVDDTAEIQARLDIGGRVQLDGRVYHVTRTLMVWKSDTTLQGVGAATVIEFAPTEPSKHCVTDRAITTRCALSSTAPLGIAANIAKGDTSFEAINASDAENLSAGDWVLIGNWDPGILDGRTHTPYMTTVDWVQVASVNGTTVTVTEPFRASFINPFPYQPTAGNTAVGITFQKVLVTQNITVQDLSVVVDGAVKAAGICILSTLDAAVRRVSVTSMSGQPLYSEYSKGATFEDNIIAGSTVLDEFATSVDLTIRRNTFSMPGTAAIGLDLGTGWFTIADNTIIASANAGMYALYHVHDGTIRDNVIEHVDAVGGAARSIGILLEGSPDIAVTGNTLSGGDGATSVGIYAAPFGGAKLPETSAGDVATGNIISGFNTLQAGL